MIRLILIGLLAMVTVVACGKDSTPECTVPAGMSPDWIRVIGCESDYALLWDERTDSVFSRTRTINWIIDREDGDRVYFINTTEWLLHYFFAAAYLEREGLTPVGTHGEFNILNYRREGRRFLLGKLIHYLDQDLLTIEFSAGDTAGAEMISEAYARIADHLYDGEALLYRPVSSAQEQMLPEIEAHVPVIRTEDVFLGQTFQPLNPGVGFGTLRFARVAELAVSPPSPTDLVVLDRVPNDISFVSGIVTGEFQTPLSHVNLLSKNRGTPNMALAGAFDEPELRDFDGTLIRLEVTSQDYLIREATLAEAQSYWDSLRPAAQLIPQFDANETGLRALSSLGKSDALSIGAKAANMAEMTDIGVPLPDSPFAIPFYHYQQHLDENGIQPVIDALLADAPGLDSEALEERLFELRWRIFRAPMQAAFRDELIAQIEQRWLAERRVRFRSSTNVEDLEEFSGAGLYTSAGASLSEGAGAIEDAVKVVWASVWNRQAFVERDFYRVDHTRVRMGVLVHPSFDKEEANGVAVTINAFAENRPAYYINSQVGEVSVTNPTGQAIPEQILYYTWYEEPEYEVITRSSLLSSPPSNWPAGQSVMLDTELEQLAGYLDAIHEHFRGLYPPSADFAMDVEFKLDANRQVVIKQARPFARR